MDIETEKKRKAAHILCATARLKEACKIELRRQTGYSMTTINSTVSSLAERGMLAISEKKSGTGSKKSVITINPKAVVVGISFYRMKISARIMTLDGEVIHSDEKCLEALHCDIADAITAMIERLLKGEYNLVAIGVSISLQDNSSLAKVLALRFGVPVHMGDSVAALAMYYRYRVKKKNTNIAVLLLAKHIRCANVGEWSEALELGNLLSPIISAQKGRLIYDEVLSAEAVKQRMYSKYNRTESAFEAAVISGDVASYAKQLQYALGELILLIDKTVKASALIVAGEYVTKPLVQGSIELLGDSLRGEIVCFDKGINEIADGAGCIALNSFLYY